MKTVIQRVKEASVSVDNEIMGSIDKGLLIMLGVAPEDTKKDIKYLINKLVNMRIFENNDSKFDKNLNDIDGKLLIISQFTLFGDFSKGRRPYFGNAAKADKAKNLYKVFVKEAKKVLGNEKVAEGVFGAKMNVESINLGPVTLVLDSRNDQT